jgi:hypothetical protein
MEKACRGGIKDPKYLDEVNSSCITLHIAHSWMSQASSDSERARRGSPLGSE